MLPEFSDPLADLLHQLRLTGSLYCRSHLAGAWSLAMPVMPDEMMFHIVTRGGCWLLVEGEKHWLEEGSVALVPHGLGHVICSDSDLMPMAFLESGVERLSERYEQLIIPNHQNPKQADTELTCGVMNFDQVLGRQLIQQLPAVIVMSEQSTSQQQWLKATLGFIADEAHELKPGGETIVTSLADIIVIQLLRYWLEQQADREVGWVAALSDKFIGKALKAIHSDPGKDWTVDLLAKHVGLSRSGFSDRFSKLVGDSVKSYVTQWRMKLAYQRLKEKSEPLIVVAESLGYQSEAAFSRAFKRTMGFSPKHSR